MDDHSSPYDLNELAESRRRFHERRAYGRSSHHAPREKPENRPPGWRPFFLSASAEERFRRRQGDDD